MRLVLILLSISNFLYGQKYNNVELVNFGKMRSFLSDKKIILIGVPSHWDGTGNMASVEIVKYLHDSLGFNVLLIETDFYGTNKAYNDYVSGYDSLQGIWPELANSSIFNVYDYQLHLSHIIENSPSSNQLYLEGFDINQTNYGNSLFIDLPSFCKSIDGSFWELKAKLNFDTLALVHKRQRFVNSSEQLNWEKSLDYGEIHRAGLKLVEYLDILRQKVLSNDTLELIARYKQSIISYVGTYNQKINSEPVTLYKGRTILSHYKTRDSMMAVNISWYMDSLYKDEKVIILSTSLHTSRNLNEIKPHPTQLGQTYTLGDYICKKYKQNVYSIAIIEYEGEHSLTYFNSNYKYGEVVNVKNNRAGSMELFLHKQGRDNYFVDLSQSPLPPPYFMRPCMVDYYKHDWGDCYDGVFFIDKTYPVKVYTISNKTSLNKKYILPKEFYKNGDDRPVGLPEGWKYE